MLRCLGCGHENKRMLEVPWVGATGEGTVGRQMHCGSRGTEARHSGRKQVDRNSEKEIRLGKEKRGRPFHKKSVYLAVRSMEFEPTHLMRFIASALTVWKTLCWALGVQMYPFKDVFWEMGVLSDSLPSAHSLQSLSLILQPSTIVSSIEGDRWWRISHHNVFQLLTVTGTPRPWWYCWCPSVHSLPRDPQAYSVPFAHSARCVSLKSPQNEHLPPSSTFFLGTWLVLPAMHLACLCSTIRSKNSSKEDEMITEKESQWSQQT